MKYMVEWNLQLYQSQLCSALGEKKIIFLPMESAHVAMYPLGKEICYSSQALSIAKFPLSA